MFSFLDYLNLTAVSLAATFVLTLIFSQKIKDFLAGVPASLRADLKSIETSVKADVANYQKTLVSKISPAPAPVAKVDVAPLAPLPPAPAPAPVPPAAA